MAEGDVVTQPNIIEDNKDANAIASMLWVWKWVNRNSVSAGTISDNPITIKLANSDTGTAIGSFLKPSGDEITVTTKKYEFYYVAYEVDQFLYFDGSPFEIKADTDLSGQNERRFDPSKFKSSIKFYENVDQAKDHQKELNENLKINNLNTFDYVNVIGQNIVKRTYAVEARFRKKNNKKTTTTESPISEFEYFDAFWIKTEPVQYYLRFGALLGFIKDSILPKVNTDNEYDKKPPIFDIDDSTYYNYMYSLPNQISLDPRVCLVRNDIFTKESGTAEVLKQLQLFRAVDGGGTTNPNFAYPMNIYLNFEFIIESLNSNADEKGDVSVYDFLKSICDGLNKALGGINNLEPIIDESINTLKILDTTPIPGFGQRDADYTLQLYGYEKAGSSYNSNFVRKVDLKTAITPEYATMITVGATAGGYVKGTEATAFSRWNIGLTDRFKEEFVPGNENSAPDNGVDEASINYVEKFLSSDKFTSCYGFSGNLKNLTTLKLSTDAIENNLSVVSEYYKYLVASKGTSSGGTIGFIPFKISFTMDGISGIKIYNKLHVDTRFLPKAYGDNLNLIVTGISHKLSNSDWETDIEATVIPKTENGNASIITAEAIKEGIEEAKNSPGNVGANKALNCSSIPPSSGLSSSAKRIVKASDNTSSKAIGYVINYLEGGYFHPLHAWNSNGTFKSSYDYRTKNDPKAGNSGETLWGIDRPNGRHEFSSDATIKKAGIAFWAEVDKKSGFGIYKAQNKTIKKYDWKVASYPKPSTYWAWLYNPGFTAGTILADNAKVIINNGFEKNMSSTSLGFGGHPLYKIVKSDGRLLFMYYRAWWNGPGWFQKFARNLKKVYDSGTTNVDKLICADLTFRYNAYSKRFWKNGISKMKDMIDFNP